MSANDNPDLDIPVPPNADPAEAPPARERWYWLRLILAGNPLYPISAALLLFGINRLSVDPNFLEAELGNLVFNFSALQLYEVLLVAIGILLARRRIWYDAAVLVGLENLLVLVPFILVTQAFLIGKGVALALCLAGTALAVLRFASLRRLVPELNMPPRLLSLGLIFLLVNVAIPACYRWLFADGVTDSWTQPNQWLWLGALPVLQLLANGLPHPTNVEGNSLQRSWLPIGMFELWVTATAVHLWCIAYVDKLACGPYLLAPLLWVAAWTAYNRMGDFLPNPAPALRSALMVLPGLATLLGAAHENSYVFLALSLLNVVVYGRLWLSDRKDSLAFQLLLASLAALLAGFPSDAGRNLIPEFNRWRCVVAAIGAFFILLSLISKRPYAGVGGAIIASIALGVLGWEPHAHLAAQTGLALLLAHSVRWVTPELAGARALRFAAAAAWMLHSICFAHVDAVQGAKFVGIAAAFVIVSYLGGWFITGARAALIIPASAVVSCLGAPIDYVLRKVMTSPAGLVEIGVSFILFGLGTLLALTKPRWHHRAPKIPIEIDPGV